MAEKRRDYFAAGTLVVWDVRFAQPRLWCASFALSDPENPKIYHRGEFAEAEPAVPDWQMPGRRPLRAGFGRVVNSFEHWLSAQ